MGTIFDVYNATKNYKKISTFALTRGVGMYFDEGATKINQSLGVMPYG